MTSRTTQLVTRRAASVGETYVGHRAFAAWVAARLFAAGGAALRTFGCS